MRMFLGAIALAVLALTGSPSLAGYAVIANGSSHSIECRVDGYTVETGWPMDWAINLASGQEVQVGARWNKPITWIECNGLRAGNLAIEAASGDHVYIFPAKAKRVLSVLLYPYLPSNPSGNFAPMLRRLVEEFQHDHPEVLLNAVINPNLNPYRQKYIAEMFAETGFDMVETDMLLLSDLVRDNRILPLTSEPSGFIKQAMAGVTFDGKLWGIPTWICMDFLFSDDAAVMDVRSVAELVKWLGAEPQPKPRLVNNFNGEWRTVALYINAYVQTYGPEGLETFLTRTVPDANLIQTLADLMNLCAKQDGSNPCVDSTFHSGMDGMSEATFVGGVPTAIGFSERSFQMQLYSHGTMPKHAVAAPYGTEPQPMLYTDALVTNAARCGDEQCQADARAFAGYISATKVREWIAFSKDLPKGMPPRRLLPAGSAFYSEVAGDPLYKQFIPAIKASLSFPNYIDDATKRRLYTMVCYAVKAKVPGMVCPEPKGVMATAPEPDDYRQRPPHD